MEYDYLSIEDLGITEKNMLYWYKFTILKVIDGDTWDGIIDYGFTMTRGSSEKPLRVRAGSFNTYEVSYRPRGLTDDEWEAHKVLGRDAKTLAEWIMPVGCMVYLRTVKDENGNFGRILADPYAVHADGLVDVKLEMEKKGFLRA